MWPMSTWIHWRWTRRGCHPLDQHNCRSNPCFSGVECYEVPGGYRCGSCPPGFTGNGSVCQDIDECELSKPCDDLTKCENLSPGFSCSPCPPGYTGSVVQGIGRHLARQVCTDINECQNETIGGCVPYSECINTPTGDVYTTTDWGGRVHNNRLGGAEYTIKDWVRLYTITELGRVHNNNNSLGGKGTQ
ncbi:Thrombospondin-3 [Bulinus truncatus]|nr:Thrombospondin-3 [Bulinus truncatus]